jgi:hypothetical protein
LTEQDFEELKPLDKMAIVLVVVAIMQMEGIN